ncbi:hypothetical protein DXG01_004758 [Tephrocybe rancida]|nr:hypothetical protein DXG01_004758 [Tephrocybe rancida]
MGPGTHHDMLDDHFGFWNWQKYVGTGHTLVKRYKDTVTLQNSQSEAHASFTRTVSEEHAKNWEMMCQKWEDEPYPKNKSKNPFYVEGIGLSEPQAWKELAELEQARLIAGVHDALENMRHILKMKARMVQFNNTNIRGQCDGTRSRNIINRVHDHARAAADKYSAAHAAKLVLTGPGLWEKDLQTLTTGNVRLYTDPDKLQQGPGWRGTIEDDMLQLNADATLDAVGMDGISLLAEEQMQRDGTGETRRTVLWIWAMRAREEVLLLKEEMRRATVTLEWRASVWRERALSRTEVDSALAEGLRVYAEDQAALQINLCGHFITMWKDLLLQPDEEDSNSNDDGDDEDGGDFDPNGSGEPNEDENIKEEGQDEDSYRDEYEGKHEVW